MSTGDLAGNLATLQRLLRHIKYPGVVDEVGCARARAGQRRASAAPPPALHGRRRHGPRAPMHRVSSRRPHPLPAAACAWATRSPRCRCCTTRCSSSLATSVRTRSTAASRCVYVCGARRYARPPACDLPALRSRHWRIERRKRSSEANPRIAPHWQTPAPPQLQGKTDQRFVEGAFRLARDHLGVRTVLTPAHFFATVGPRGAHGCACAGPGCLPLHAARARARTRVRQLVTGCAACGKLRVATRHVARPLARRAGLRRAQAAAAV